MRAFLPPGRDPLVEACLEAERLGNYAQNRPLDYIEWTPPQEQWLRCDNPRKLLRAGNQIGKTWAGLSEVIWRATGTHPWLRTKPPPVEIWIVCTTWPQSVQIMKKFWQLLPKELVKNKHFDPRYGFGKDNPAVVFHCGSIVRFKTTMQGAEALAGATIDYVLIDEPTDEPVYRELDRRVMRAGGAIGLTLTPINRPVEYLRQLVRDGAVYEIHAKLSVENLTPRGWREPMRLLDGTLMDAAWIAEQRKLVLPRFAPIILDGEWETRLEGVMFAAFNAELHVTPTIPQVDLKFSMGFDYGEGDFRQAGILVGVDETGDYPKLHFVGENFSDGMTTPEEDACGTLDLLDDVGLPRGWRDLKYAIGDKPTTGRAGRKSNLDLTAALERELRKRGKLGRKEPLRPQFYQAKTGKGGGGGSQYTGCEFLHRAMLRPGHFTVHPSMERFILCLQRWQGSSTEEWKDGVDGGRYAVWPWAIGNVMKPTGPRMALA